MHSITLNNFYKAKILSSDYPMMKPVFQQHSFEIFQFLERSDLNNLKATNKFFNELCDCHFLFSDSIKTLSNLFLNTIKEETQIIQNDGQEKKSKFKEKYNFNKSMNQFYKNSEILNKRIQSGKNKKK